MHCIYCGRQLVGQIRPAHIVPEGMGGRLTSTTTVCNDCNNSFAGIEGDACERLAKQGALVGALRGDREQIAATIEFEGSNFRASGARMDELAGPPTERGRVWSMPARREDQIKRAITALRSRGLPPEAMLDGRFRLENEENVPPPTAKQVNPIEFSLIWCDRPTKRVMTKMAVELLARLDGDAARRPELAAARRFARYDEGDFYSGVDTETSGARLPLVDAPYIHAIEVWTANRRLHYRVILFKELRFIGTLTDCWGGRPLRASYSLSVQDPAKMLVQFEAGDGATLVNKSFRVRRTELDAALVALEEFNLRTSERKRTRAPQVSFEDLYPDVVKAMKPK
jgi:hypothetical protein